jgi:hypothetical protein
MTVSYEALFDMSGCQMYQLKKKGAKYRYVEYIRISCRYRESVLFLGSLQSFYGLCSFSDNELYQVRFLGHVRRSTGLHVIRGKLGG